MAKLPAPPGTDILRRRAPAELHTLPTGTTLWRIYRRGGCHPSTWDAFRDWGPVATARFDHHEEPARTQERAIIYVAAHGPTCLAEVFQDTRVVDRSHGEPWLAAFALTRPVTVLDLTGAWPTRAGASMAIASGPRARARRWSQAIYAAFPEAEGLLYGSSMDANRRCIALYERAQSAAPQNPLFHRPLSDPGLAAMLRAASTRFGYALV